MNISISTKGARTGVTLIAMILLGLSVSACSMSNNSSNSRNSNNPPTKASQNIKLASPVGGGLRNNQSSENQTYNPSFSYLEFQGNGEVRARPDTAQIGVNIQVTEDSSQAALRKANGKTKAVIAALKKAGVAAKDIQTSGVSAYQEYETRRWQASNSLNIRTVPNKAGQLLTLANQAGADGVSGPSFSIENKKAYYEAALKDAIADAQTKATAVANLTGGKVISILSVREGAATQQPIYDSAVAGSTKNSAQPVPIEAGEQVLSIGVTVVFSWESK